MYELDHIVHFVDKPEEMPEKTKQIGLHTVLGGKHEVWGTYNSLCYCGLTYIEFIGIFDETLIEKSAQVPYTLHSTYIKNGRKNGFTRIAFRTNKIENDAEKFRKLGFEVIGPDEFSRIRPDGSIVKWKLLHIGKKNVNFDYPFFIEWEQSDKERFIQLTNNGTIKAHDLGPLAIEEVCFLVNDLKIAEEWASVFHLQIEKADENELKLKGTNCTYRFSKQSGKHTSISKVVFNNSKTEKEIYLENACYRFKC